MAVAASLILNIYIYLTSFTLLAYYLSGVLVGTFPFVWIDKGQAGSDFLIWCGNENFRFVLFFFFLGG